ncbi:MAG TPA: transglutaminase domain-containing protein [Thermoanaerobaculales bacterium]|nr:transglutaminase domain-containing protein [Thermoanaerobaculales bacterium]HQL29095.1 transglutaminase domain-containing protein [Thermoanaerobaculales bacterium]HQN97207.1 transglutaminase domain-containing protein [Thermoanaerobaculales bacterium]HQP42599.1 transglutaminase domain-containing protein [Thermoanaerobaculales bacterium]
MFAVLARRLLRNAPAAAPCVLAVGLLVCAAGAAAAGPASIDQQVRDHVERAVQGGLDPEDFHHLVLGFGWRDTMSDRRLLEGLLDRLSAARPIDPLMADEVRRLRAELAYEAGRPEAARELLRAMGGVTAWWVDGPQPIGELEDFPELAQLPGDGARWRAAAGGDPLGWVRVAGLAWPARRQLVTLAASVSSEREQPVAVRLGVAQVARAWLNGDELLTTAQPLQHAEDQFAAGGWLRAGRNLLVVAVASETEDWWLRVRLTAPDGSRLDGVRELDDPPQPVPAVAKERPQVRSLEDELRRGSSKGRQEATLALAAYLVDRRPQPVGGGDARSLCQAARAQSPGEARLLEWTLPSEPGLSRELLEEAIAAAPDLHWARIALARWYLERELFEQAADVLEPALAVPAVRATALEVEAELWGQVVLPTLAELSLAHPGCVSAAVALGELAADLRRLESAREAAGRLAGMVPSLPATQDLEERLAEDCGDPQRLRELVGRRLADDPNRPELRIRLSRLVAADQGWEAARQVLEEGLARCPDHVDLLIELARVELAAGSSGEAAAAARRVLELRPQDLPAQRLLEFLGEEAEDLGWLRTVDELWALAERAPAGSPAVLVLDHVEVRFLPAQLTETRAQQAYLIRDGERAEEWLAHTLAHVPERQRLRVLEARIVRRDGTQVNARQSDTPRLAEPEINLYYDARLRVLKFQELQDGDLVELAWVLSETAESNDTGPYKGGLLEIGHPVAVGLSEVELSGPEELLPAWDLVHLEGEPERVEDRDGIVRLRWEWRDLPAHPEEVPPAPRLQTVPHLVYSNHPRWGELATWYERHIASRVRASRQVEDTARRLTEGVNDRLDRIARIYGFVTTDIDYVGLEFGEHRYRPFSADWVLSHKIGDCKDKAALMVALLEAVDIPARMVMLRTFDRGTAVSELALLEIFDHAIVYLPQDDLWLDGTAAGHAPFPPPGICQGAQALVVDGPASTPRVTPAPGAGYARYRYRLERGDGGMVTLEVRTEDTGEAADRRRLAFAGSSDPRRVTRWLQSQFPGAELVGEPKLRMVPGRDPTVLELEGRVVRSALLGAGGIKTFPGDIQLSAQLAPGGERRGPLLLPVRPDLEWTVEVELGGPPGELPPPVELKTAFGELKIDHSREATGYRVTGSFRLEPGLVGAADAAALRRFLVEVERHLGRPLEVP